MNATKKLTLALALALGSSQALALGLGQIRVKSALNQPLRAEIPVRVDNAGELRGLQVALASPEDFARVGLNLSRMDVPLKFKLVRHGDGAVIEVSTEQPVGEPALDFLIEVNWANGKLLREYSVLLDPPSTAPVASPATRHAAPAAAPARASRTTTAPAPAPAPSRAAVASGNATPSSTGAAAPTVAAGETYTVAGGDTLWRIASEAGGDEDVNRMMLAIQRANPQAFIDDNINTIRRGAVLRIPGRDEVTRLSSAQARAEVRRQMDQWRASHAAAPSVLAQAGGSAAAGTAGGTTSAGGSHLELVPPGSAGSRGEGRSGVEGGTGSAEVSGLKQELTRTKESLASEQQKSEDLAGRVKSLEDINGKNQRLLELKNSEIAALQDKLAEAAKAASAAATPAAPLAVAASTGKDIWGEGATAAASATNVAAAASIAPALSASATIAAAGSVAEAASAQAAASGPVVATPAETQPAKPVQAAPVAAPAPAAPPWYMRPITWLIAGLALLALLLLGFLSRRRKPAATLDDVVDGDAGAVGDYGDDSEDEYALIDELEQHPDELSLHLELASLYYAHRDQAKFEAAAERMHAYVDDPQQPEWQQVRAMGEELCPDHPLFSALHSDGGAADAYDDNALPDTAADDMPPVPPSTSANQGYNFDFDLTPTSVPAAPVEPETIDFGDDGLFDGALDKPDPTDGTAPQEPLPHEPVVEDAALSNDDDDGFDGFAGDGAGGHVEDEGFSSDPVDTKLDLARAYQEMGDAEGARAMLEEVLQEGSAAQQDAARKLLDELR